MSSQVNLNFYYCKTISVQRHINQAFLQLEFSIKLLTYTELRKIDKDDFDTDVLLTGKKRNLTFNHSAFNSYNDLIFGAQNTFNLTLGYTSIVLDTSLQSIGIASDPYNRSAEGMLRTLIYMIRCAYAHDMMNPRWEVRGAYAQALEIHLQEDILKLDLFQRYGHPFNV